MSPWAISKKPVQIFQETCSRPWGNVERDEALDLKSKPHILDIFGDKAAMRGLQFWSMSYVLIFLRTTIETKALIFEEV